jgi:acetolactate synthase small subunit
MTDQFSESRLQNMLHEARAKSSHIESQLEAEEDRLNLLKARLSGTSFQKNDLIKSSKIYKLVVAELSIATKKIEDLHDVIRLQEVELASLRGKRLINADGKLKSHEIEESLQFINLSKALAKATKKNEDFLFEARETKQKHDALVKDLVRVLENSLEESSVAPSRREFLMRKIEKLSAGDLSVLTSILVDLSY